MSVLKICFGYGWGVFKNGDLSSDLVGFQKDTSSESAPQLKASRDNSVNFTIKRSEVLSQIKGI